jgi:hypothetical protein
MESREGICIALVTAILAICYFSPDYDCFGNLEFFGNYAGPQKSLNQKSLQAGFPFYDTTKLKQSQENGTRDASIRNYDGSIANGYQPFILRPPDSSGFKKKAADGTACSWPCYAGSKHEVWCNEQNSIDYYAMRPLVRPKTYNEWLINLFKHIIVPGNSVSNILDSKLTPKMYCTDGKTPFNDINEKTAIMKWLMARIAVAVTKIPQLQKNGSWKNEEFHHTDSEMYAFTTDNNKGSVYKLVFNLYNPLRSTSTLVEAVVISPNNQGYTLVKMNFVSKGEWDESNENMPKGYNLPNSNGRLVIDLNSPGLPNSTLMDWNYGNTLNVQEFNEYGFYENGKNVEVKGGVPESLKSAIAKHEGQMLLPCATPRFTGVDPETNKPIANNGVASSVLNNPSLIYKKANFGGPSPVYN